MPDHGVLTPELGLSPADHQLVLRQDFELGGVEDPGLDTCGGQPVVRTAKDDQAADVPPAHPVKVPRGNPVQRHGDQTDVVFRQHRVQRIPEAGEVHGLIAQHGRDLAERIQAEAPELGIFRAKLKIPPLPEAL